MFCDLLLRYKPVIRTATRCKGEQVLSLHPKDLIAALDLMSRDCVNTGQLQGPHVFIGKMRLRKLDVPCG